MRKTPELEAGSGYQFEPRKQDQGIEGQERDDFVATGNLVTKSPETVLIADANAKRAEQRTGAAEDR